MYGYYSCKGDSRTAHIESELTADIILEDIDEFEQLKSDYPEHELYLFAGRKMDMALFIAPGFSAMLIETRSSP